MAFRHGQSCPDRWKHNLLDFGVWTSRFGRWKVWLRKNGPMEEGTLKGPDVADAMESRDFLGNGGWIVKSEKVSVWV